MNGAGHFFEVIVAAGMMSKADDDVVAAIVLNDGGVVQPIFPGTPFADDANFFGGEGFDEFDLVVGDLW